MTSVTLAKTPVPAAWIVPVMPPVARILTARNHSAGPVAKRSVLILSVSKAGSLHVVSTGNVRRGRTTRIAPRIALLPRAAAMASARPVKTGAVVPRTARGFPSVARMPTVPNPPAVLAANRFARTRCACRYGSAPAVGTMNVKRGRITRVVPRIARPRRRNANRRAGSAWGGTRTTRNVHRARGRRA